MHAKCPSRPHSLILPPLPCLPHGVGCVVGRFRGEAATMPQNHAPALPGHKMWLTGMNRVAFFGAGDLLLK